MQKKENRKSYRQLHLIFFSFFIDNTKENFCPYIEIVVIELTMTDLKYVFN
jgi:hypothetical protein